MPDSDLDANLLAAWRGGDINSGRDLFERHADPVARFFENKVRVGAEDLTQTTFLRLVEGQHRLREGLAFRAYVLGIARNVLREHLRVLARGREVDLEVESMVELAPGPSTMYARKREERLLLEALRNLAVDDQVILELRYWEELGTDDIAAIMERTPSTLRGHLVRARKRLRETMATLAESRELLDSTADDLEGWATRLRNRAAGGPARVGSR